MKISDEYTIDEHRHRFAAWAAAAASRRGFATNATIIAVLDSSSLRKLAVSPSAWPNTPTQFDRFHKKVARAMLGELKVRGREKATYGRAAKIIAIYLKTLIVVGGHHESPLASIAHPPIDRVLLQALAKAPVADALRKVCRNTVWTSLDEEGYLELIKALRRAGLADAGFWTIERYWNLSVGG